MTKDLSNQRCTSPSCGIRHELDEFPAGSWVIVQNTSNKLFGWIGQVESWSQYNCPVYYCVSFGVNRENFDPCELRSYKLAHPDVAAEVNARKPE